MVYLTSTGVAASTANLFISTSNNVGIGTTSPGANLTVYATTAANTGILALQDSATGSVNFIPNTTPGAYNSLTTSGDQLIYFTKGSMNTGCMTIAPHNAGHVGIRIASTANTFTAGANTHSFVSNTGGNSMMTILGSGNVGIGYDSPQSRMHVQVGDVVPTASGNMATGVIISQASGGPAMCLGARTTGANYTWIHSAYTNNSGVPSPLVLQPIGGRVGVGITAPGALFQVNAAVINPTIPTVHIGDNANDYGAGYGMVHLVRNETPGDTKAHLSLIRNGRTGFNFGFYNNTDTFGMWHGLQTTSATPTIAVNNSTGNVDFSGIVKSGTNPAWNLGKYGQANQSGLVTYSQADTSRNVTIVLASGTVQVPVAGFYQLNFHSFVDSSVAGNGAIYFRVNGNKYSARVYSSEATAYRPMTISAVVSIAANDILTVFADAITLHGNDNCNFSGHLIA
jgi:hypothetical protein